MTEKKIKVGISACLLGERVRYDGSHKLSRLCQEELSCHFNYVSLCPEVGIGMGVPRKPIHLVGEPLQPRAVGVENPDMDVTTFLQAYVSEQESKLEEICGYIFMQRSPSCGLFDVNVYRNDGQLHEEAGRGVFARAITDNMPLLPVEEAGRLENALLRENFIARVKAYAGNKGCS